MLAVRAGQADAERLKKATGFGLTNRLTRNSLGGAGAGAGQSRAEKSGTILAISGSFAATVSEPFYIWHVVRLHV